MASRKEAGGPEVIRPGVLGTSRAIGQGPQRLNWGRVASALRVAEDGEGGSVCHCLCVPSHHSWVSPVPKEGQQTCPSAPCITSSYKLWVYHLSGYVLQGTGLPRTPRSKILLQLCEAQFLGAPLCLVPPPLPKHSSCCFPQSFVIHTKIL